MASQGEERRGRGRARGGRQRTGGDQHVGVERHTPGMDDLMGWMAGLQVQDEGTWRDTSGRVQQGERGRGGSGERGGRAGGRDDRRGTGGAGRDAGGRGSDSIEEGEVGRKGVERGGATGDRERGGRGLGRGRGRGREDRERSKEEEEQMVVWTRPQLLMDKKGTSGQPIHLRSNYYQLTATPALRLCLYHVEFSPEEERTGARKALMRQHTNVLGNYIFDGMQLFLSHKLGKDPLEMASKRPDNNTPYMVKIRFIKELPPSDPEYLKVFSLVVKRCLEYLGLTQVGQHYFDPTQEMVSQKHRVAVWPGQQLGIRQHEHQVLLCTDVIHKFLRLDTMHDLLRQILANHPDNYRHVVRRQVLGNVVMTKYNQRTYTIHDVAWNITPTTTFNFHGSEITYLEYYQQTYQVTIKDHRQPLLLSRPNLKEQRRGTGSVYLIPELCVATGLTDAMRNDHHMMRDLAQFTRMDPERRVQSIRKFSSNLFNNEKVKAELQQWGMEFSKVLSAVRGRVLPQEIISMGPVSFQYKGFGSDWIGEVKNVPMTSCAQLTNWVLVFPSRLKSEAEDLLSGLRRVSKSLGMVVTQPAIQILQGDTLQEYVQGVGQHSGVKMVVCILPNSRLDRYAAIKRHVTCVMSVPSQMVVARTLQNKAKLMSVVYKIAIQINCKLGGEAWRVHIPFQNAMVVGYDAFHDRGGGGRGGASWGAVVASYNHNLTKFYGQVTRHANREELTSNFRVAVMNALNHYAKVNGQLPERVLVYRDGVGDGQLLYVRDTEVTAIKACFEALGFSPRFSFVVVSKRINSRLFTQNPSTGQPANPPPGTVCDDVITRPERYDFYLVSQQVNQGTVTPTCYNIIEDMNSNLDPDRHQRLAYKLSFLYCNWMGPVRVPAPCLYAHKLASVTGQALKDSPPAHLRDKLWYL
ncbi:hypothetical protein Pcinc_018195 [Petrolisthes cinctipes]|uniref:Piwi-like protein 1 n=1 Tax=Petrolisthes cinctipes TaxID=88211 RepID=A0AAE1FNL2_PETCI|nr:hypothetical protein Pcinc_018195 [Petrolisthes cinctipes]